LKELDGSGIEYFVLPPLCPLTGSPYDFSQSDALIDRAIKSTDAWIAAGGFEKPNVHAQLSIHKHGNQKSVRP
jgi:NTE family protein